MIAVDTAPAPPVSRLASPLPLGACDAHSHIFGPFEGHPPQRPSVYALPDALPEVHAAARTALGVTRGCLTQPAPYGDDPSAMLAAIAESGGVLKGVAVADADIGEEALADWCSRGIVGLRFTEIRAPSGDRYPGSVGFAAIEALAPAMRRLGLHAQLWGSARDHAEWLPRLLPLGLPLILDHMGVPDTAAGVDHPHFAAILDALQTGQIWVKLVLARVSRAAPDYLDAKPFHDAYVAAAPDRLVWGSDWPYVRMDPAPDAAHMLRTFLDWAPEEATRNAILVANPAALYGFE